jgi:imidazolonepropionase-like amidohydrolase
MRARGTMLEPTLRVIEDVQRRAETDTALASFRGVVPWVHAVTRRAHAMGIPIVAGTDLMGRPGRDSLPLIHDELDRLVAGAGLTPLEAIAAATSVNARALGIESAYGTIAPGMAADLVVLAADPSADIANTRAVRMVVKAGAILVQR